MKTLAVIQHTSAEYLGLIEDHFEGRRIRFRYFRPFTSGGRLPGPNDSFEGLVLLGGGPWGSAGVSDVPTLDAEVALCRDALHRGLPLLGIGLGAQVLCHAAGGGARPCALTFDVCEAKRVTPDALNGFLPARYPLVRFQRDRAVLPASAVVLATGPGDEPCLFRLGARALGFSGHPGIKTAMAEDLVMELAEPPPDTAAALVALREKQPALEDALVPIMTGVVQILGLMEP